MTISSSYSVSHSVALSRQGLGINSGCAHQFFVPPRIGSNQICFEDRSASNFRCRAKQFTAHSILGSNLGSKISTRRVRGFLPRTLSTSCVNALGKCAKKRFLERRFFFGDSAVVLRTFRGRMSSVIVVRLEVHSSLGPGQAGRTLETKPATTGEDGKYMKMCVELARKAVGHTSPNPMVGCVIVKDGEVIGRGFHPKAGEPHAEVFALKEAGTRAEGATAYVSLEPCNHFGRTPPCSQSLILARLKRVVVGTMDPNPLVAGNGVRALQKAGIEVLLGIEEALCMATIEAFTHRMTFRQPFVTVRYSMSLDGAFLDQMEDRSNDQGSYYSHLLQEYDAVVVTDTSIFDNPTLLSSELGAKQPLRIIVAKSLYLPLHFHVFNTEHAPTLVVADKNAFLEDEQNSIKHGGQTMESQLRSQGVEVIYMKELNVVSILQLVYEKDLNSLLLDLRAPQLPGFLSELGVGENIVQKVVVSIVPTFVGNSRPEVSFPFDLDMLRLDKVSTRMLGPDVIIEGYTTINTH